MTTRHFYIEICQENGEIIKNNEYVYSVFEGVRVQFDHSLQEHQNILVYSPDQLKGLIEKYQSSGQSSVLEKIKVLDEGSLTTPSDCVLNFADARQPGGLYFYGENTQEEALCRQSTLYASISSEKARVMYDNNRDVKNLDTDYLLLSPCVEVFRDRELNLLEHPHTTAVISVAAPNLYGRAHGVDISVLRRYYRKRIKHILCVAAENGYKSITLGAWGCGAFGNDPMEIAAAFKDVLVDDGFGRYFDRIIFPIPDVQSKNYQTFYKVMNGINES